MSRTGSATAWVLTGIAIPGYGVQVPFDVAVGVVKRAESQARADLLATIRAEVEGLPGEPCRPSTDSEWQLCAIHNETMFDGVCEDWPEGKMAVLAILDRLAKETPSEP